MLISILIAVAFLIAIGFVVRGVVARSAALGKPAQSRFNKRQRLRRMMTAMAVLGGFCLMAAFGNRPTPYEQLLPAAGRVSDIVTVSERSASNRSSAPTSLNPFTPHDWVELTVEPTSPDTLKGTVTWKVNTIADRDTLRHLYGDTIKARVKSLSPTSEAYEVVTSSGESFVRYEEIATFERRGMILYLCGAGFFFLLAVVMFLRERSTPVDAA